MDVFGSSGGAVTGLALVATYPDDVAVLVAHEPPIMEVLPDAELAGKAYRKVTEAYHQRGFGAGMARFIALTSVRGEFTPESSTSRLPTRRPSACRPRTTADATTCRSRASRTRSPATTCCRPR